MSLLSDNVIPGNHGKLFGTNAKKESDLELIKSELLKIEGIKDVILHLEEYPYEFTVHTSALVRIQDIKQKVIDTGFHAIPKGLLEL